MGKKKGRRRGAHRAGAFIVVAAAVMAFSLAVRWSGLSRRQKKDGIACQIEVLNGTGEKGIAMKVAMQLRSAGVDVLIVGNAGRFDFSESLLVDRRGNRELVGKLARFLGCRRVLQQIKSNSLVDATLILGWDNEKLRIEKES